MILWRKCEEQGYQTKNYWLYLMNYTQFYQKQTTKCLRKDEEGEGQKEQEEGEELKD